MEKKKLWILTVGLLLVLALLWSCAKKEMIKEEDMPGGLRDRTWEDAPKTIKSKEITRFECEYRTNLRDEEGFFYYIFTLQKESDGASCQIIRHDDIRAASEQEFQVPLSLLLDLQVLADQHDLARYNGINRQVNGLPEFFGARLLVDYTSGERIRAYDNSSSFLDYRAADAIYAFFMDLNRQWGSPFTDQTD